MGILSEMGQDVGWDNQGFYYFDKGYKLKERFNKISRLYLSAEMTLAAECRAHLTAYDDFIFGLKANQMLYERLEQREREAMRLEARCRKLIALAAKAGIVLPELEGGTAAALPAKASA